MRAILRLMLLVIVVLVLLLLWTQRERWTRADDPRPRADAEGIIWEPLTEVGAARARTAIQELQAPGGPPFISLRAGELASYIRAELARRLPPSAEDVRAAVSGELLLVRASVRLGELGGSSVLGPLAAMLPERDTVRFGGLLEVVRPGLAQLRVREIRVGQLRLPQRLIPRLIREVRRGTVPEGIADEGLPLVIPEYIREVRVTEGRINIHRNGT